MNLFSGKFVLMFIGGYVIGELVFNLALAPAVRSAAATSPQIQQWWMN